MSGSTQQQQQTNQTTNSSPWSVQQPYLQNAFSGAQSALNSANANYSTPSGFVAGLTPSQQATFQSMINFGLNGSPTVGADTSSGTALTGAGANATTGALTSLGAFDPSSTNNTGANITAANQYVAGQNIPAQVQADMLGANQEAQQVTLPGIDQSAAGSGNINSSRTGIADGLVQQGLAEQAGALGAQLQGNAYNTGLQLAENTNQANNAANLSAFGTLGSLGNSTVGTGVNAGSAGISNQGNLFTLATAGGQGQQSGQQDIYSNELAGDQYSQTAPFTALQNYLGLVNGNYGGTSTTTGTQNTTTTPSIYSTLGALLGGGGSLLGGVGSLLPKQNSNPYPGLI